MKKIYLIVFTVISMLLTYGIAIQIKTVNNNGTTVNLTAEQSRLKSEILKINEKYDTLTKETEYNGKITKTNTLFMRLEIVYRFINMDNPSEFIDIITYGDGLDTGDKAPGKAMTY